MLRRGCDGQAMIELMVAVLLLLLVITGILHINKMVWSSLFLHSVIRGTAGEKAMSAAALADTPEYIKDWQEGQDNIAYTADDKKQKSGVGLAASISTLTSCSTAGHNDSDWSYVSPNTRLAVSMSVLRENGGMGGLLTGVHTDETLDVPVEPVIRDTVYGKESVKIKEEVWMPLMGGLL